MEYVIYLIGILLIIKYLFTIIKYIKTKEFRKKAFEGNIVGVIAYTFFTTFIINILILWIKISHDKINIINLWIIFLSGLLSLIFYPIYWSLCLKKKNTDKRHDYEKNINTKLINKYGSNEVYGQVKMFVFDIPYNTAVEENFNELVSVLTNNQISFFHPREYQNITDVYSYLYLNGFFAKSFGNDSIYLTCLKINALLEKLEIKLNIKVEDIIKDDDQYIKNRRKDMIPTLYYDLNKINEYIIKHSKGYELVTTQIVDTDCDELLDVFLCIGKTSSLSKIFDSNKKKKGKGDSNE